MLVTSLILSIIVPICCTNHSATKLPTQKTTTSDRFDRNNPFNLENIINDAKDRFANIIKALQDGIAIPEKIGKAILPVIAICKSNGKTDAKAMLHIINIENNEVVYPGNKKALYLFMVGFLTNLVVCSGWIDGDDLMVEDRPVYNSWISQLTHGLTLFKKGPYIKTTDYARFWNECVNLHFLYMEHS